MAEATELEHLLTGVHRHEQHAAAALRNRRLQVLDLAAEGHRGSQRLGSGHYVRLCGEHLVDFDLRVRHVALDHHHRCGAEDESRKRSQAFFRRHSREYPIEQAVAGGLLERAHEQQLHHLWKCRPEGNRRRNPGLDVGRWVGCQTLGRLVGQQRLANRFANRFGGLLRFGRRCRQQRWHALPEELQGGGLASALLQESGQVGREAHGLERSLHRGQARCERLDSGNPRFLFEPGAIAHSERLQEVHSGGNAVSGTLGLRYGVIDERDEVRVRHADSVIGRIGSRKSRGLKTQRTASPRTSS